MQDLLEIVDVSKTFKAKSGDVRAVDGVSFKARKGEVTVIVGPSGSGKTTLLYLLGSLEKPDSGEIRVFGEDICAGSADLITYRRESIGFVFQFFNLITALTALENVILPMDLDGVPAVEMRRRAVELLERVGIDGRLQKARANKMSGGEKQRVAIARALANDPARYPGGRAHRQPGCRHRPERGGDPGGPGPQRRQVRDHHHARREHPGRRGPFFPYDGRKTDRALKRPLADAQPRVCSD